MHTSSQHPRFNSKQITEVTDRTLFTELDDSDRLILLACLYRGDAYNEQLQILQKLARNVQKYVKICILDASDSRDLMHQLHITGTPTYLLYDNKKEIDRMLGKVCDASLDAFLKSYLTLFSNQKQNHHLNHQP